MENRNSGQATQVGKAPEDAKSRFLINDEPHLVAVSDDYEFILLIGLHKTREISIDEYYEMRHNVKEYPPFTEEDLIPGTIFRKFDPNKGRWSDNLILVTADRLNMTREDKSKEICWTLVMEGIWDCAMQVLSTEKTIYALNVLNFIRISPTGQEKDDNKKAMR